jgi:hypothetical protein
VRDHVGFGAESDRPEDTEVTETSSVFTRQWVLAYPYDLSLTVLLLQPSCLVQRPTSSGGYMWSSQRKA